MMLVVTNYLVQAMNAPITTEEENNMRETVTPAVGDVLDRERMISAPAGTKFFDTKEKQVRERASNGFIFVDGGPAEFSSGNRWVVVEVPEPVKVPDLSTPSDLVEALWGARTDIYPAGERNPRQERTFRAVADFVLDNFELKAPKPDKIQDGEGDYWFLAANGFYFHAVSPIFARDRARSHANRTLESIRDEYGIRQTVA